MAQIKKVSGVTTGTDIYNVAGLVGIGTTTPVAKLDINGSLSLPTTYLGDGASLWSHTASTNDYFFECESSGQNVEIELPPLATSYGTVYCFKKVVAANSIIIDTYSGDYWDDDTGNPASLSLTANGETIFIIAASRWRTMSKGTFRNT